MTTGQAEELADAIGLLVSEVYADEEVTADLVPALLRVTRCVKRIEDEAFKRGVDHQHMHTLKVFLDA